MPLCAAQTREDDRALDGRQRHQHPLRACRTGAVGRAVARDGRHARQLGRHRSRPEQALPHAALRPTRLGTLGKGAPTDHHRNPGRRPRSRTARQRPRRPLPFRHRRRRHHAGADLHEPASRSHRELRVLQSIHRRRSQSRGRARRARGPGRARRLTQGACGDARQILAGRYGRSRRLCRLPRALPRP